MSLMGFREYARHRKCTLRAVQKAIEAGRIVTVDVAGKPKIDSDQADRSWVENTDPAKQSLLNAPGPDTLDLEEDEEPAPALGVPVDERTVEYRTARAQRERIGAERAQLELDQLKGKLIDVNEAKRIAFTAFRTLRDNILNVPSRIKDQAAAETDPIRVEQLIENELDTILSLFDPARALQDQDDSEDDA